MKKEVTAHIECNSTGFYSIYVEHGDLPFNFFGDGETEQEAKDDFMAVYEAMRKDYKERTGKDVEASFSFVKDMSAVLQECKEYISFAYLAQLTGISKAMLSQYACGTRRPKSAQRERIVGGIHQIGQTCMQVGVC